MTAQDSPSWRTEVLQQLDDAQEQYLLIGPGNVHYPSAALHMDGFSSDNEWLLILQMLGWSRRENSFFLDIQAFGSNVAESMKYTSMTPILPVEGEHFIPDSGDFQLDIHDFTILISGAVRHFQFSASDYEHAGIDVDQMAAPLALIRMLAYCEADTLMLSPSQLLEYLDRSGIQHLFTLAEWCHPDEAEDEMPSEMACFRDIARAIEEHAPPDLSACTEESNTHWSHWLRFE